MIAARLYSAQRERLSDFTDTYEESATTSAADEKLTTCGSVSQSSRMMPGV